MKPTQEQIKEFWEHFVKDHQVCIVESSGATHFETLPIDLNNLFKYAVPKARGLSEDNTLKDIEFHWQGSNITDLVECDVILDNDEYPYECKDPALVLFWALWQVKEISK